MQPVPCHRSSRLLGCGFLLCTAVTWVAASFLAQYLVSGRSGGQPSLHPFLLTYICTSLFSLYLPIIALKQWLAAARGSSTSTSSNHDYDAPVAAEQVALLQPPPPDSAAQSAGGGAAVVLFPNHTRLAAVLKVLPVAVIFVTAQTLFTVSLANTSVTSNTILSSSASMWTLLTSALVLRERVTAIKLLSVVAVMAGTAMVTLADSSESAAAAAGGEGDRSLYGDALCVASAMCYSCYTVIMQRELREDDPDIPALFFGYVGVLTAVLGAPVVLALHLLGSFDLLSLEPVAVGLAVVNGLLDYVLADYTMARAVLLLSPTVATLGASIQVPLATAADLVLGQPHWIDSRKAIGLTAAGTFLVLGGVGGINLAPSGGGQQRSVERGVPSC